MTFEYHTMDLFTDRAFAGNPLAVVPDARGLGDDAMKAITREFNYSETVFVLPPSDSNADRRVRIFTPARELPFAGHPTVGTAALLSELEIVRGDRVVLQEGVGNVSVRISRRSGVTYAELTVPGKPEFRAEALSPEVISEIVGLSVSDLESAPGALATVSCGVPFNLIQVRDEAALARARTNESAWRAQLAEAWARELYLYCVTPGGQVRARMFSPGMGIVEDPATGAAAAALAAHLASRDADPDADARRTIAQGVEMGRPSRIEIGWTKRGGDIESLRVGGHAVRIAQGTIRSE